MHNTTKTETFPLILLIAALAVGLVWTLYGSGIRAEFQLENLKESLEQADCQEDEPCWDCNVHGNRICGTLGE